MFSCTGYVTKAQLTLVHHYNTSNETEAAIVNLDLSGKKIMLMTNANGSWGADTAYFYNMDYSFWKSIPFPHISGFHGAFDMFHELGEQIGVTYPSEKLFNTDSLLEVAVLYMDSINNYPGIGKVYIINENGILTDSILNVMVGLTAASFRVTKIDSTTCVALVTTTTGVDVYTLPGMLANDFSENYSHPSYAKNSSPTDILTTPSPNPSTGKMKITFELPGDTKLGELRIYNESGVRLKTYKVDNRFGFIMIDNSELPAGLYYYNIVADGKRSKTQKILVVK
jgi:hypothetical protein